MLEIIYNMEANEVNMFRGVIFDLYGTLVKTDTAAWNAAQPILSQLPIAPMQAWQKLEEYHLQHILSLQSFVPEKEIFIMDLKKLYDELGVNRDPAADREAMMEGVTDKKLYSEAIEVLGTLQRKFPIIVASNSDKEPFQMDMQMLGGMAMRGFCSETLRIYKPKTDFFLNIAWEVELNPDETVYIGDSYEYDVKGATLAGMASIWINRRGLPIPEGGIEPMAVLSGLRELPAILH